jgi:hypothetical protein
MTLRSTQKFHLASSLVSVAQIDKIEKLHKDCFISGDCREARL